MLAPDGEALHEVISISFIDLLEAFIAIPGTVQGHAASRQSTLGMCSFEKIVSVSQHFLSMSEPIMQHSVHRSVYSCEVMCCLREV